MEVKSDSKDLAQVIDLAEAKIRSKEWANGRGDIEGVPKYFIDQARRMESTYGTKVVVFEGK